MIDDQFNPGDIARVRRANPLLEVLAEHGITLAPTGRGTMRGRCPFCQAARPFFEATTAIGGYWMCWDCARGGDVITFVRDRHGITFADAVINLAARAGITL